MDVLKVAFLLEMAQNSKIITGKLVILYNEYMGPTAFCTVQYILHSNKTHCEDNRGLIFIKIL